jgi:HK97 family phage prohead protease
MLHKSFQLLETKAEGDHGEFTAIVSTFGNIDKVGDRIMPGAWTKTLEKWTASGDPVPIILAHQWNDPMAHIGIADPTNIKQVDQGLQVTGTLDIGDNPVAAQVYKLMKRRSLKEFSIGYDVPPGGEKRAKDGANEISEINLAECGPCLIGIDPKTELQSIKSALEVAQLPDAEEQREEAERVAREEEEARLPDVPPVEPEHKADEPDLAQQLQEVKDRLATAEQALENLTKTVDETGKEPAQGKARSVDPLREQAEAVALEFASDGLSLRRPPKQVEQPKQEPEMSLSDLKDRMREEVLVHLSGDIT